jgi:hypothetical protein
MIDTTALLIAIFGMGALGFSFLEYTLSKRKSENAANQT